MVEPRNRIFWEAFQLLSKTRRPVYSGFPDILLADIESYCNLAMIRDPGLRMRMARVIVALDDVFIEEVKKRQEAAEPAEEGK